MAANAPIGWLWQGPAATGPDKPDREDHSLNFWTELRRSSARVLRLWENA